MGLLAWLLPKPLYYNYLRKTSWLDWGPHTDPNKVAPITASFAMAEDWPFWCHRATVAQDGIEKAILGELPPYSKHKDGMTLEEEVADIRLKKLTHYKCETDWNHEFIRADFLEVSTEKPLITVWERDVVLEPRGDRRRSKLKIKSGAPCASTDNVIYITEKDFDKFIQIKDAFKLRTVEFYDSGPTLLDVYAVLETHSVLFPMYEVYTTMCYWYADSTFQVLIDLYKNTKPVQEDINGVRKGMITWRSLNAIAYKRTASQSGNRTTPATSSEAESSGNGVTPAISEALIEIENTLNRRFSGGGSTAAGEIARLPEDEQEAAKKYGWNAARFIKQFKSMPSHEKLLETSKARIAEVLEQLDALQKDKDEKDAAARREQEAKDALIEEKQKKIEEQQKALQEEQKKNDEQQKVIERLQRQLAQTTVAAQ